MPATKSETAARNDAIRKMLPMNHRKDRVLITRGIQAMGPDAIVEALGKVRNFDTFNEDNDPWAEHDFGSFEVNGTKCFWKIDDYQGHDGIRCVLTILRADEY